MLYASHNKAPAATFPSAAYMLFGQRTCAGSGEQPYSSTCNKVGIMASSCSAHEQFGRHLQPRGKQDTVEP